MAITYPIRPVSAAELPAFVAVGEQAFNSIWPFDEVVRHERKIFEPERSLGAFDGDQLVGTALVYTFRLTVPGGGVDVAGVSGVNVLPTHRRRGILSALMGRQLADVSSGSEPVAALFASEAGIYGRYGYGMACGQLDLTVRGGARLAHPAADETSQAARTTDALTVRLAEPEAVLTDLRAIYDTVQAGRPGMLARTGQWWEDLVDDPDFLREGHSRKRCVVVADAVGARGYALYTGKPRWGDDSLPAHELLVREFFALDPAACAALWRNLLSRDLVSEIQVRRRPVDDPLLHMLANRREARPQLSDGLWIRLIDLPAALTGRRYACPVDAVIEVTDHQLPANSGRWRLRAGGTAEPEPATCERTSAEADIALGIAELGAAYLGGTRLGSLADAGLVSERRPGTLAGLSAGLSWDPLPWSPMMF
jgi:predicted acetyltransferase